MGLLQVSLLSHTFVVSASTLRLQRRLDTITCDGNYYGLIAFHNTVKGVMYGESGFV